MTSGSMMLALSAPSLLAMLDSKAPAAAGVPQINGA